MKKVYVVLFCFCDGDGWFTESFEDVFEKHEHAKNFANTFNEQAKNFDNTFNFKVYDINEEYPKNNDCDYSFVVILEKELR